MNTYERLAEEMLALMDAHRHAPPEPVSGTIRGEMAVLRLLGHQEAGLSAGAIAAELEMTTSRVAAVLKSLEKKAMITRKTDLQDKRCILVELTGKGRAYHDARRQDAKNHMMLLLEKLGEKDAETFVYLAGRIISINPEPPCTVSIVIEKNKEGSYEE